MKKIDRYTALGILALAKKKNQELRDLEAALAEVLKVEPEADGGEFPYYGHVSDAISCGYSLNELLGRLGKK